MTPRKDVPLNIALWFLALGENPAAKLSDVRVAAYLARRADESGSIASLSEVEPLNIAKALDIANASVYRALGSLESLGFIAWEKTERAERFTGQVGRVSLILDHVQG